MTTTTPYGSWHVGSTLTVENYVGEALGDFVDDYDIESIADELRNAINDALPDGVSLCGNELYGPWESRDREDFDLIEILEGIDFFAIADKHDKSC